MLINHSLTFAKLRLIELHKLLSTGTASNICIKPLRLPMELKQVQSESNVCRSKTLHISFLAAAKTRNAAVRFIAVSVRTSSFLDRFGS